MIFLSPFLVSFFVALAVTFLTIKFAAKFGLVDDPKTHKHPAIIHKSIIPRAGGIPIFAATFLVSTLMLSVNKEIVGIFIGGAILVVVGLVDDRRDIGSLVKLLAQLLAAIIVVGSGVGIAFITNPLGGVIHFDTLRVGFNLLGPHSILVLSDIFAVFWIVWVINMVNFSSGVDGQMPGIVFIALMVIFIASLRFFPFDPQELVVSKIALIGAGATLGFLVFNFFPAKIFPGDAASYFLGYLVAVVAILSSVKLGTAILVMAIPLIDGVFTILRRIAAGHSPFEGDRSHLHHRLLHLGWGQRRIALFYWVLCAILGAAALLLPTVEKVFAGVVVVVVVVGGLLWLNMNLPQKARG